MANNFAVGIDKNRQVRYNKKASPMGGRKGAAITVGGLAASLYKGGEAMRITFHVGDFTVTIMIKKRRNRHPAR